MRWEDGYEYYTSEGVNRCFIKIRILTLGVKTEENNG
jgi:hypothetical protein